MEKARGPEAQKRWEEVQKPRKGPENTPGGKRSLEKAQKRPRGPEEAEEAPRPRRGGKRSMNSLALFPNPYSGQERARNI